MAEDTKNGHSASADKAKLDKAELKGQVSRSLQKVELDLDDALFLEEMPEPEGSEPEPHEADKEPTPAPEGEEPPKKKKEKFVWPGWKSRLVLIPAAALLLLVALGVSVAFFLHDKAGEEQRTETARPEAPEPAAPESKAEIVAFAPFWVEYPGNGTFDFLQCSFAFPVQADQSKLISELDHKRIVLRDALFYYLRNKDLVFLRDQANVEALKKDLLGIVNQYLGAGQLEEILIEEYVIR